MCSSLCKLYLYHDISPHIRLYLQAYKTIPKASQFFSISKSDLLWHAEDLPFQITVWMFLDRSSSRVIVLSCMWNILIQCCIFCRCTAVISTSSLVRSDWLFCIDRASVSCISSRPQMLGFERVTRRRVTCSRLHSWNASAVSWRIMMLETRVSPLDPDWITVG